MSKRLCNFHGMWTKDKRQTSCPQCKTTSSREYDKNYRNKEADKFYHSRAWKDVRENVRTRDAGLCQQCSRDGKLTEFDVVDHIIEIEDGGDKLCKDNLECLCHPCHNFKTSAHKKQRGGAVKSLQLSRANTEAPSILSRKPFVRGTP